MAAPEVVRHLHDEFAVVLHRLELHRHAGGEGRIAERALTEAVDGEDGCLVEGLQRGVEPQPHRLVVERVNAAQAREQVAHERIARRCRSARRTQLVQRLNDAAADALAQFGRGRLGEGDHQDLLHIELPLEQQPQVQRADVPGLAGAGRGLDQADATERAGEDVQRLGHGASPWGWSCATTWPNTALASLVNWSSRGSPSPRSASR